MVRKLMIALATIAGMRGFHAGALAHSSAAGGARAGHVFINRHVGVDDGAGVSLVGC